MKCTVLLARARRALAVSCTGKKESVAPNSHHLHLVLLVLEHLNVSQTLSPHPAIFTLFYVSHGFKRKKEEHIIHT